MKNLTKGDIVSIVGAGGKTSLMFSASSFLKTKYKVLITTTTKIYFPSEFENVLLFENSSKEEIEKFLNKNENGIYVIGKNKSSDNKLLGLDFYDLDNVVNFFDTVFIESDGSKRKSLKGWNDNEPVIYRNTTKTIGLLDIKTVGMKVSDENIHRIDELKKITKLEEFVNIKNLVDIIYNGNGLFRNYIGEKILFINKVESKIDFENSYMLLRELKEKLLNEPKNKIDIEINKNFGLQDCIKNKFIDKIFIGSVENNYFEEVKGDNFD